MVDCPSLTQQGKSSADINLVLDAVDALAAPTRYEEFVIVSADADFTPLALRCRAADRRVTIMTASPAAAAYRAVADHVITADDLAELVTSTASTLNVEAPRTPSPPPRAAGGRRDKPERAASPARATHAGRAAAAARGRPRAEPLVGASEAARKAILQRVRTADRPVTLGAVARRRPEGRPDA